MMSGSAAAKGPPGEERDRNTFRILVSTDNHLGYMEKDPVRKNDSWTTFQEILGIARERNVDFVLLGGDLFHDNKPSRWTLFKTMELLRQYCMGDKPCEIDFLSDQSVNFHSSFGTVNYQDPNYNVAIPVFSIHGNHDDPSGESNLAALDILSMAGLVNYFGKSPTADEIQVTPLLMRKGDTKLAVYGLGNVRDERLYRTIVKGRMTFLRPEVDPDGWFNLLVIHQNRVKHTATSHIPETFIDSFIHFIIWGHEHESIPTPVQNLQQGFDVVQPGSSIATSLSEGEAKPKHVGILHLDSSVNPNSYFWEALRLRSVRPFVMDEVELKSSGLVPNSENIENDMLAFLIEKVDSMIKEAEQQWLELQNDEPDENMPAGPQPLIRLKVEYSGGFSTYPPQRFGSRYVGQVANAKEILQFYRKKASHDPSKERRKQAAATINQVPDLPDKIEDTKVEDLVTEYLTAQELDILPENELGDAVKMFVEKDDKDAIKEFVIESLERIQLDMKAQAPVIDDDEEEDAIQKKAADWKRGRVEEYKQEAKKTKPAKSKAKPKRRNSSSMEEDEDFEEEAPKPAAKGRGKAATAAKKAPAKSAAAKTKPAASRKRKASEDDEDDEDDVRGALDDMDEDEDIPKTKAKPRARKVVEESDDDVVEHPKPKPRARKAADSSPVAPAKASKAKEPAASSSTAAKRKLPR
ncbi:Metallo-dependent phosphatase-like protein [Hyaloraphidium curvatum]|nr:Metallo-dependent phosphatase-like protein [Hyaloraphidium curvatum]